MLDRLPFRHVVAIDFEFEFGGHGSAAAANVSGERPRPVCMVARDLRSSQTWRLWRGQFGAQPPFPLGNDTVLIAYYASAELGCFKALGWPPPRYILDLFTEFRARINGVQCGAKLVNAAAYFGIDAITVTAKRDMVSLILRGAPWSAEEQADILGYCERDVVLLERLLPAILPRIDLQRALLRGRFMKAAAAIEWNGIPIDTVTLDLLRGHWTGIQDELIAEIDHDYSVYEGRSFRRERWEKWLARHGIPWPSLESGQIDLSDDSFRQMARVHPKVSPMRELRSALSEMRLSDLAVGSDGRNRTILSAFQSRTGRCQPSNTKYIFGPSVWLRGLIQPPKGWGVAYLDWCQQEHGIAAVLSGDAAMQAAYTSGDPYLEFAKQAGAVPSYATKSTHRTERELFKQCVLAVGYGMEAKSLAQRIGQPEIVARDLLRSHRETYYRFWSWSDATVDRAMLLYPLLTAFGWPIRIGSDPNPRSLRNFPCQANGAEMLRFAACFATEEGIEVCALIHDAVLIAAPLDQLDNDIERMKAAMAKASRVVLDGFELRTDVNVIQHPGPLPGPARRGDVAAGDGPGGETRSGKAGGGVMDDRDDFNIENLRVGPELMQQALEQRARKGWRRFYTMLPREWELRLHRAKRISTYRLAIELLYLHWHGKGKPVTVSSKVAQAAKISARSKWEALAELERLGLIVVNRKPRRSPRVTPLHTQAPKSWA